MLTVGVRRLGEEVPGGASRSLVELESVKCPGSRGNAEVREGGGIWRCSTARLATVRDCCCTVAGPTDLRACSRSCFRYASSPLACSLSTLLLSLSFSEPVGLRLLFSSFSVRYVLFASPERFSSPLSMMCMVEEDLTVSLDDADSYPL